MKMESASKATVMGYEQQAEERDGLGFIINLFCGFIGAQWHRDHPLTAKRRDCDGQASNW